MKKIPEWAENCLKKEKEGLKPTKHEKDTGGKKNTGRKERKV